jgi:hypothetical protein
VNSWVFSSCLSCVVVAFTNEAFKDGLTLASDEAFSHVRHKVDNAVLMDSENTLPTHVASVIPDEKLHAQMNDVQLVLESICVKELTQGLADKTDPVHGGVLTDKLS